MDIVVGGLSVSEGVWVPFAAALMGGVLSLFGSFVATWLNNRTARLTREEELERIQAERAYGTFHKLFDAYNSAANLREQINGMFDDAAANGAEEMEPWAKVTELVGAPDNIEPISPSETAFLISMKKADLLNDVHLIQRRIANIMAAVDKYASLRAEMHDFQIANMSAGKLGEGTEFMAEFHGNTALHAEMLTSRLNNLVGQIMEMIDSDIPRVWDVLVSFEEAARQRFRHRFPEFKLDKNEPS
ncbi:hypothetical protein P6F26_06150 [Roseibacterium sp. SDUM158017]|uniref:hypothetical protein n=1 Tax=Roseicyclus salinarum TaxID=3036773 RepID=UPI00241504F3|nr:hypothetical protein [Roseibacterium sp. SDUM158017]MDG4648019.1 hypothetical protein [Roseibacterium sp. SDUM158017]